MVRRCRLAAMRGLFPEPDPAKVDPTSLSEAYLKCSKSGIENAAPLQDSVTTRRACNGETHSHQRVHETLRRVCMELGCGRGALHRAAGVVMGMVILVNKLIVLILSAGSAADFREMEDLIRILPETDDDFAVVEQDAAIRPHLLS